MDVIILAGGFGRRLKRSILDIPKPMAPINNRPFLDYLFDYLIKNNLKKIILSVHYKYEIIYNHYNSMYKTLNIEYSVDSIAYGTGGAINNALKLSNSKDILVVNGDTYFDVEIELLFEEHINSKNDITMCLKPMSKFDRYGIVKIDTDGKVLELKGKEYCSSGLIDGGLYIINKNIFNVEKINSVFSFNSFISKNINKIKIGSLSFDKKFIDIGIPKDYHLSKKILENNL